MKSTSLKLAAGLASLAFASTGFAGGYEKGTFWSAEAAGLANAVVSSTSGADALYFNPAGLGGSTGWNVRLHFSPTFAQFKGPTHIPGTQSTGSRTMSPVAGGLVSYGVNEKLAVGLGVYVAAGSRSEFPGLDFSVIDANLNTLKPDAFADFKDIETSLGVGYKLTNNFKIGASWRISMVKASFATPILVTTPVTVLSYASLSGLSTTSWTGFRLGAQYLSDNGNWGLGVAARTQVGFTASGDLSGSQERGTTAGGSSADTPTTLTSTTGSTASNTLPFALEIGGHFKPNEKWTIALGYNWTQYSKDKTLELTGTLSGGLGGNIDLAPRSIAQNWKDQHTVRVGVQFEPAESWALRLGYLWATAVTSKADARATFTPPGPGQELNFGVSKALLGNKLDLAAAFGYGWASASTTSADQTVFGDYAANAYAFHMSAGYKF